MGCIASGGRMVEGLPTVNSLLRELESREIVKESTGRARDRVFVYRRYLEALAAAEEAPSRPIGGLGGR
jgi:hypothetical protein